ncbi:peptidyl-tRNA hydrolase [Triangularia verruculosa]|uniref:peptidyl-tRNA hydrolase n=1 Tax=Triangularia verruculosa TaxID=2587418 RepID=A0AAN7AR96_9PEZI|nr:peptidyl-tRNA hydrolase [Triangularia verruculosa]
MSIRRVLVVGLGNPGEAYRNTYHSAGNIVLEALQKRISATQPSFSSSRHGKKSTLASIGPKYSFLQSPSIMNVTGPWFAKAYKEHLVDNGLSPAELGVVLVHDDLEEELGVVKIRDWARSHRGHNGIKSVNASLKPDPEGKWARVSIGIGRPAEREKASVSDYVLSKIPRHARGIIEEKGGAGLLGALMDLEKKWEAS